MKKVIFVLFVALLGINSAKAQIQITVDPGQEIKKISPYIYGKNGGIPADDKAASWQQVKAAGVTFFREGGGNNSTKYNWQKKLTGHPDWYQNIYGCDWDQAAQRLQAQAPGVKGMWTLQLLGWAANNSNNNFGDWNFNQSQWWDGVGWRLAGGGKIVYSGETAPAGMIKGSYTVTTGGVTKTTQGYVPGDYTLYLEPWPAESSTGILPHWFNDLNLNKDQFQYWEMDNEPECWNGTHADVMPNGITAEEYMQKYFAVAKLARSLFPNIKIVGPVFTNEWQWYAWMNQGVNIPDNNGSSKTYCWSEYFIKRISEEQAKTGVRLLDVLSYHAYLNTSTKTNSLNLYRTFYDTGYASPDANAVKQAFNSTKNEYIFKRATDWLNTYMGTNNGVTLAITELGSLGTDPNVIAVSYASLLGTFAENNVEILTPWNWDIGQWETVHLFSQYTGSTVVRTTNSSNNLTVSAYSSINNTKDTLSIALVNRDTTNIQAVKITPTYSRYSTGKVNCYQLSGLPATETFNSATDNALKSSQVDMTAGSVSMSLPKLSVTVIQIPLSVSTGCSVGSVESPAGATISGQDITADVATDVASQVVSITTSPTVASWKLYSDAACTTEITNKTMPLSVGANTAYIKVTAEDGVTTKIYTLVVNRAAPTYAISITPSGYGSISTNMKSATEGTTVTLTITPVKGYEINAVSIYKTGDEATVVTPAGTGNTRTFAMPAFDVTVTVTFREILSLSVSPSSLTFAAAGEQRALYITSNTAWAVSSDASWLTVSPASGSNNGTITVTAEANMVAIQRTATITVSGTGVTTQTISITQNAGSLIPTLSVSPSSLNFIAAGEQQTFSITSNTAWTVSSSDSWLTVSPASGSNNGTVTVTADANTATTQRTATITVSGTGVTTQTINVTQNAASTSLSLSVSPTSLTFVSLEEQQTFSITSNTAWTVSSNASWLTVSPASGSNNGTVTVTADANTAATQRTATITVSGTGVTSQTISITQDAASLIPILSVSPSSLKFIAAGEQREFSITSNTNWTVSSSDSWLTVSPASGENNATITVTAAANTATTPRTASITVDGIEVVSQTIAATQDAAVNAIENIRNASFHAYFANDVLNVESSHAETVAIYSVLGVQLYSTRKDAGLIEIPISTLRGSIFIIKGSISGSIKIVK